MFLTIFTCTIILIFVTFILLLVGKSYQGTIFCTFFYVKKNLVSVWRAQIFFKLRTRKIIFLFNRFSDENIHRTSWCKFEIKLSFHLNIRIDIDIPGYMSGQLDSSKSGEWVQFTSLVHVSGAQVQSTCRQLPGHMSDPLVKATHQIKMSGTHVKATWLVHLSSSHARLTIIHYEYMKKLLLFLFQS